MPTKSTALTPHCKKVLEVLHKSAKPMGAYELLDKLHKFGIKAPPTVYRALESLVKYGLVHRIESLNAYVACHGEHNEVHKHEPNAQFAVCRSCGSAQEIHDEHMGEAIKLLGRNLKFHIERQMLELMGLCERCSKAQGAGA